MLISSVDQIKESESRYHAWNTLAPGRVTVSAKSSEAGIAAPVKQPAESNIISAKENLVKRKEMLRSVRREPVDFAYERAIGHNDSVYSNFCELITAAKQKVGRVVIKDGNKNTGFATGFMVSERLLLTNWHVFQVEADATGSEVEFNYELDVFGRALTSAVFKLNGKDFFYSNKELDYCLVAVETMDVTGSKALHNVGYLYLDPGIGKLGEEGKELLNIIHHPDGDYKQLSIRENKFTKILTDTVWYESDTAQGSSGSPVFNDQWQVVALHHMGVPAKTADGKHYVDKYGKIIDAVQGKIDIAKICWIANEGIRISVLLKDLFDRFPASDYVQKIKKPTVIQSAEITPVADSGSKPVQESPQQNISSAGNMVITIPAAMVQSNGGISITVQGGREPVVNNTLAATQTRTVSADFLDEIKRVELENAVDYSNCQGYIENFLGTRIPIPKPNKKLQKFIARLKDDNSNILKYHHFSTLHHSARRMPAISAINIDGDSKQRLDMQERVDVWLRDKRLAAEIQLNDSFYTSSGFDRGHMSRREDADWATTAELAKQYADLTCVYTNACPQVPALNRSNKSGLWGKLEKLVLENGVEKEGGKSSKISVFNGPVFADTDPVFNGVQIPMEFWKLILWYDKAGRLKATAFKLSQSKLVGDIDFEELDFSGNPDFVEYQCSIASLQASTNLQFSGLLKYDTFKAPVAGEKSPIHSEEAFKTFVQQTFQAG